MFNWYAALEDVKKRMAELEKRISALREELQRAERETDKIKARGILTVREQELERTKAHAEFIEYKIAAGGAAGRRPHSVVTRR
jgi:hypothetical protein